MKTIFRTLLVLCAFSISTSAFAQVNLKSQASPSDAKEKKALVKDNSALKVSHSPATASPRIAPASESVMPGATTDPNAPVLEPQQLTTLEAEHDTYDFGKIIQEDVVKHVFVIKNTGPNNLVLENVKPSCGCTAIQWPREPIAPGETAEIEAQFNSRGKMGPQHKNITITYNGADRIAYLTFTGEVVPKAGTTAPATNGGH